MAESKTQDPKYIIIDGALANAATREFIPDDEPIFIMRGKDIHATETIIRYACLCGDSKHAGAVNHRVNDFIAFRQANPDRMGEPDTAGADYWPDLGPEAK